MLPGSRTSAGDRDPGRRGSWAEERTRPGAALRGPLLFELLNQMDGLADDADVLFLLTTNRPDILEPALAARPGGLIRPSKFHCPTRMPQAAVRAVLRQTDAREGELGYLRPATEGASAAFIREMMRKAALFAADESSESVEDRHLDEAIHELVVEGGSLTQCRAGSARPARPRDLRIEHTSKPYRCWQSQDEGRPVRLRSLRPPLSAFRGAR